MRAPHDVRALPMRFSLLFLGLAAILALLILGRLRRGYKGGASA